MPEEDKQVLQHVAKHGLEFFKKGAHRPEASVLLPVPYTQAAVKKSTTSETSSEEQITQALVLRRDYRSLDQILTLRSIVGNGPRMISSSVSTRPAPWMPSSKSTSADATDVQNGNTATTPTPSREATTEQEGESETKGGFQPTATQHHDHR
jgi:hypothetical protein